MNTLKGLGGPRPPGLATWLAEWLLPSPFRDTVLGDWSEEYRIRAVRGRRFADLWYWRQVVSVDLLRLRRAARRVPTLAPGGTMSFTRIPNFWPDARLLLRGLARDRMFTFTTIAILGLGIGISASIYAVIRGVLLEPLPYDAPHDLVAIWGERTTEGIERAPVANWDVVQLREQTTTLGEVAAFFQQGSALQSDGPPVEVGFGWMTANLLTVMGVEPMLGRGFHDIDDRGELVVILDHGIWQTRFGADSAIVGRTIRLAQQEFTVVGVLPSGAPLQLPARGFLPQQTDVWSFMFVPNQNPDPTFAWMRLVARLAPGATIEQSREELRLLAQRAREELPDRADAGFALHVDPLLTDFTGDIATYLWLVAGAAGVLVLIVGANVANLMLLRGAMRRHLTALRVVLGATRWRLVQSVLLEGALLSTLGAAVGLFIASGISAWLRVSPPPGLPRIDNVVVSWPVFAFAGGLAVIATVVLGLGPGARLREGMLDGLLRQRTGSRRRVPLGRWLVVAEVALSVTLLVGSGLLLRTMQEVARIDPGFAPQRVLTFRLSLPNQGMTLPEIAGVMRDFETQTAALPGVESVGAVHALPLTGALATGPYARSVGELPRGDAGVQADYRFATPGYLESIGARLVGGRHLRDDDQSSATVIDAAFARVMWPSENPVGRTFAADPFSRGPNTFEVVGVVESLRHESLRKAGRPTVFFSARHYTPLYLTATVKTSGDPTALVGPIREVVATVHADMAMARVKTMDDWVTEASAQTQWSMWIMMLFAGAAAVLSAIGLYGVLGHLVTGRRREIGIRVALGASRQHVMGLVLASGVGLTALGLVVGLGGAVVLSRSLEAFLFGVSPGDPITYLLGATILAVVALIASWLPARRAVQVNPVVVLKEE